MFLPSHITLQPIKGWQHPRRREVTPVVWSYRVPLHCWVQQRVMLSPPLASSEQEKLHQHQSLLYRLPEVWDLLMETITCGRWLSHSICPSCRSPQMVEPPLRLFLSSLSRNSSLELLLSPVSIDSALHQPAVKGRRFKCQFWVR